MKRSFSRDAFLVSFSVFSVFLGLLPNKAHAVFNDPNYMRCEAKAIVRNKGLKSVTNEGTTNYVLKDIKVRMRISAFFDGKNDSQAFFTLPCLSGQFYSYTLDGDGNDDVNDTDEDNKGDSFYCRNDKDDPSNDRFGENTLVSEGVDSNYMITLQRSSFYGYVVAQLINPREKKVYANYRLPWHADSKGSSLAQIIVDGEMRITFSLSCRGAESELSSLDDSGV